MTERANHPDPHPPVADPTGVDAAVPADLACQNFLVGGEPGGGKAVPWTLLAAFAARDGGEDGADGDR